MYVAMFTVTVSEISLICTNTEIITHQSLNNFYISSGHKCLVILDVFTLGCVSYPPFGYNSSINLMS